MFVYDSMSIDSMSRARSVVYRWQLWLFALPLCSASLAVAVLLQTVLGTACLIVYMSQGFRHFSGHERYNRAEHWQVMATVFATQLCFAAGTLQALGTDNSCLLTTSTAFNVLNGILWLAFVAVVEEHLPLGSRGVWGTAVVVLAGANLLLIHMSYRQMGWRQHSWLSCDLRRKHAAQRQQLQYAINWHRALSTACMHVLAINIISGAVLVAAARAGPGMGGHGRAWEGDLDGAGNGADMGVGQTGVLVSIGLTALPVLWLTVTHAAFHYNCHGLELLATSTLAGVLLFPALQLFFAFSPAYGWPTGLVLRLLLLALPMAVWMVLLLLTWRAFRAVMALLRQSWAQASGAGCASSTDPAVEALDSCGDSIGFTSQVYKEHLKPLLKGAWLVKQSTCSGTYSSLGSATSAGHHAVLSNSSRSNSSVTNNPGSSSQAPAAAGQNSGLGSIWQAILQGCRSRRHFRFFQLSLDLTTLRWSWNKYCLLYFADSISCDAAQLTITLHMILEPDLQLTFADSQTWGHWATGLQLVLQLLTGVNNDHNTMGYSSTPGSELQKTCNFPPEPHLAEQSVSEGQQFQDPADGPQLEGTPGDAAIPHAVLPVELEVLGKLQPGLTTGLLLAGAVVPGFAAVPQRSTACSRDALQHRLVKAALYTQCGVQQHITGSEHAVTQTDVCQAHPGSRGFHGKSMSTLHHLSRRPCQYQPDAAHLLHSQAMAQLMLHQGWLPVVGAVRGALGHSGRLPQGHNAAAAGPTTAAAATQAFIHAGSKCGQGNLLCSPLQRQAGGQAATQGTAAEDAVPLATTTAGGKVQATDHMPWHGSQHPSGWCCPDAQLHPSASASNGLKLEGHMMQLPAEAPSCSETAGSASKPVQQSGAVPADAGAHYKVFGAFRMPAGLQTLDDPPALQQQPATLNVRKSFSFSYSSSNGDTIRSSTNNQAGGAWLRMEHGNSGYHSSSDANSSNQQPRQLQLPAGGNAVQSASPSGAATQFPVNPQRPFDSEKQQIHAQLPPSKQRQLLLWLQQQSSGSCPESDGPQMSPCYSLEHSGQLQAPAAQLTTTCVGPTELLLLQGNNSIASQAEPVLHNESRPDAAAAAPCCSDERIALTEPAIQQLDPALEVSEPMPNQRSTSDLREIVGQGMQGQGQVDCSQVVPGVEGEWIQHCQLPGFKLSSSVSLPAVLQVERAAGTTCNVAADLLQTQTLASTSAIPQKQQQQQGHRLRTVSREQRPAGCSTSSPASNEPGQHTMTGRPNHGTSKECGAGKECNAAASATASTAETLSADDNCTLPASTLGFVPCALAQAPVEALPAQPSSTAAVAVTAPAPVLASAPKPGAAGVTGQSAGEPAQSLHAGLPHWGPASLRSILAAVNLATHRAHRKTVSIAGSISSAAPVIVENPHCSVNAVEGSAEQHAEAEAAGLDDGVTAEPRQVRGLIDKISSLKSFVIGTASASRNSIAISPAEVAAGARSARHNNASFSSSCGGARSLSAAWRGSFAARSTWSDWEASMSQVTMDECAEASTQVPQPAAEQSAENSPRQQQQQQQQQWRPRSSHNSISVLTPVLSVEQEGLPEKQQPSGQQQAAGVYQHAEAFEAGPAAARVAPADGDQVLLQCCTDEHQQQLLQEHSPLAKASAKMQAAYEVIMLSKLMLPAATPETPLAAAAAAATAHQGAQDAEGTTPAAPVLRHPGPCTHGSGKHCWGPLQHAGLQQQLPDSDTAGKQSWLISSSRAPCPHQADDAAASCSTAAQQSLTTGRSAGDGDGQGQEAPRLQHVNEHTEPAAEPQDNGPAGPAGSQPSQLQIITGPRHLVSPMPAALPLPELQSDHPLALLVPAQTPSRNSCQPQHQLQQPAEQQPCVSCLQQDLVACSASADSAPAARHPHTGSTPQLLMDDSYVVKSPTPSHTSLHSHFSHNSVASHWWLEGCGGSPTSAKLVQGAFAGTQGQAAAAAAVMPSSRGQPVTDSRSQFTQGPELQGSSACSTSHSTGSKGPQASFPPAAAPGLSLNSVRAEPQLGTSWATTNPLHGNLHAAPQLNGLSLASGCGQQGLTAGALPASLGQSADTGFLVGSSSAPSVEVGVSLGPEVPAALPAAAGQGGSRLEAVGVRGTRSTACADSMRVQADLPTWQHCPLVRVELIEWSSLQLGRHLGSGSEATVVEGRYLDAPVAVKEGASSSEIDMFFAAGVHDNLVGLRGITQKPDGSWCLVLEHCGRGTLDMLLHHSKSPLQPAAPTAGAQAPQSTAPENQQQQQQQQRLTRPDLPKLLPLMRGIARGLLHLHSRRPAILHRDIKPANILIGHGMQMKIGDLGMARHVLPPPPPPPTSCLNSTASGKQQQPATQQPTAAADTVAWPTRTSTQHSSGGAALPSAGSGCNSPRGPAMRTFTPGIVGTITYTAPEVLGVLEETQEPLEAPSVEQVLKADVYSLGVTLWEMVERRRPFDGLDGMQLWAMWVADPHAVVLPPLTVDESASDLERDVLSALQQLTRDCTALRPDERPSMQLVLDRIRHLQKTLEESRLTAVGGAAVAGSNAVSSGSV